MRLGPGLVPQPLSAPATPTLTPGSSGTLPSETIYVTVTYVTLEGETTASAEASVAVTGPTGSVVVTSPAAVPNAISYNVYAAATSGAEMLQTATPVAIGTNTTIASLVTGTVAAPTVNTSGSPFPEYAFNRALNLVLQVPTVAGNDYTIACYNCAGHILIGILPTQEGTPVMPEIRKRLGFYSGNFGIIQSAADQGTSDSLAVPDALKQLTIGDLQFTQSPWGRAFLAFQQDFGGLFGLT